MTEQDCIDFIQKRDLVNPLYQKFRRLGCWFCVKQNLDSLRRDYPAYWNMLMQWDDESPRTFKPRYTVHELDRRFSYEDIIESSVEKKAA